jgi:hypothetical protein
MENPMGEIVNNIKKRRFFELAGITAPIFFVGVFIIEGFFRTNYDPIGTYISALSLGPYGWIQILNFIIFGLLLFFFTLGVISEFKDGKASKAGPAILFVSSFCFFLSGPFVTDPMGTAQANSSIHGILHGILGGIAFLLMPITCFVFFARFRNDSKWYFIKWWTLASGIFISLALIFFTLVTKVPSLQKTFNNWQGLIQRIVLIPYMIWIFAFALSIYRKKGIIKEVTIRGGCAGQDARVPCADRTSK